MVMTLRWYGTGFDSVTLQQIRQVPGVHGVITTLYDSVPGDAWELSAIQKIKKEVADAGLKIAGIESVNIHDDIKIGGGDRDKYIENYCTSIRNLGAAGIKCICYNFMPVLDWARTDLSHDNPNGTTNLYFSHAQFAYFDIHILKRENAAADYSETVLEEVAKLKETLTEEDNHMLVENIIVKTQGFVSGNIKEGDAIAAVSAVNSSEEETPVQIENQTEN